MRFFIFFALIFGFKLSLAQLIASSDEQVEDRTKRFLNTTMLVVLEDENDSYYNVVISNTLYKYWKLSKYKLIKQSECKSYLNQEQFSFLSLGIFKDDSKTITENSYFGLNLSLNEPLSGNVISYSFNRDSIPIYNQMYRLIAVIQMMHDYLSYHKLRLEKTDSKLPGSLKEYYNSRRIELDNKKIVVNKYDLNKYFDQDQKTNLLTLAGIEENFKVKPEIVSVEKLSKYILKQDPTIAFVDGYGKYTNIVTAKGGRVIATDKGYVPDYKKKIIKSGFLVALICISGFLLLH